VNYNQVVVKCQILQECFLQNFNMQKFQICIIQIQGLFKDFQGPGIFFPKFKDFSSTLWTLSDPYGNSGCQRVNFLLKTVQSQSTTLY